MKNQPQPKIIIAGCGPSGMLTALSLACKNTPVTIIEKRSTKEDAFFSDPRAIAITQASKEFFESIGIWDKLSEFTSPFNDIYVVDNKAPVIINFSSSDLKNGKLMGYLIECTNLKKILFEFISKNPLINLIEKTSYEIISNDSNSCELKLLDQTSHKADLMIVCDGYNSIAKKKYFSSLIEKSYDQHALTFMVHHEKSHEGTAVEHFMPSGPFASLPLRDKNLSSIVWTISSDKKDLMMNLPKDEFRYLVQENFGEFLGKVEVKSQVKAFSLNAYATKKYYNKRIALIADTAHMIHPLAGQGLNQGIKDIKELAFQISTHGVNELSLESYQKAREKDNINMLEITDKINSMFSYESKIARGIRQIGFFAIEKIPPLKKTLLKYAMGKR